MPHVDVEQTRLYLEGMESAISASVTRRGHEGMVVTQALPFLRRGTAVTESGRRTRIARVAIAMDGDVPRLLLELQHDADEDEDEDDTVETFTPGVSSMPARTDSTVPYELGGAASAAEIVLTDVLTDAPELSRIVRLPAATPMPWYVRLVRWIAAVFANATSTPA